MKPVVAKPMSFKSNMKRRKKNSRFLFFNKEAELKDTQLALNQTQIAQRNTWLGLAISLLLLAAAAAFLFWQRKRIAEKNGRVTAEKS